MNASETRPASRKVPVAGSVQRPWPWHLFAAVVVLGAAVLGAHHFLKPALGLSLPTLSFRDGGCSAEFDAINNTVQPETAVVRVIFGFLSNEGPSYQELARMEVPVALMPRQRKSFACNFLSRKPLPLYASFPNAVRVEIISYHSQIHESTN